MGLAFSLNTRVLASSGMCLWLLLQIGIGEFINHAELNSIASAPALSNVLVVNDFTTLADTVRLQVAALLCNSKSLRRADVVATVSFRMHCRAHILVTQRP